MNKVRHERKLVVEELFGGGTGVGTVPPIQLLPGQLTKSSNFSVC